MQQSRPGVWEVERRRRGCGQLQPRRPSVDKDLRGRVGQENDKGEVGLWETGAELPRERV